MFPQCDFSAERSGALLFDQWELKGRPTGEFEQSEISGMLGKLFLRRVSQGLAAAEVGFALIYLGYGADPNQEPILGRASLNKAAFIAAERVLRHGSHEITYDGRKKEINLKSDRRNLAQNFRSNLKAVHFWMALLESDARKFSSVEKRLGSTFQEPSRFARVS